MAGQDVFAALQSLSPISHSALPSADTLSGYLSDRLRDTRVLTSSLPPSGSTGQEWKEVKLSARENPMGFGVFKLTAKDGKGAWFARRSVHDGIGFARFRRGLEREFGAGEGRGIGEGRGSVRGIGRERMLKRETCGTGQIEVNYLSAQFPGPSAPRDFVAACLASSETPHGDGTSEPPTSTRQFSIISRPVLDHPECPDRQGYVRGQYESLEFIREIPAETNPLINRRGGVSTVEELKRAHSVPDLPRERDSERMGRKRGKTITSPDRGPSGAAEYTPRASFDSAYSNLPSEDPEKNPVEWIMITRSDPGGSVPRWMVERGTPGSIVKDAEKFLDWVAENDELAIDYSDEDADTGVGAVEPESIVIGGVGPERSIDDGLLASAGVRPTTPPPVYTPIATTALATPTSSPPRRASPTSGYDGSNASSPATFTTALDPDMYRGTVSPPASPASSIYRSSAQEEIGLSQLLREKSRLAARLSKEVEREEKKRTKQQEQEKKMLEKHIKDLEKREEKYRKDIEKAKRKEEKRERKDGLKEVKEIKDVEKREEKHRKDMEKVKRKEDRRERKDSLKEVRELKGVVEGLTRENMDLRTRVEKLEGKGAGGEKN